MIYRIFFYLLIIYIILKPLLREKKSMHICSYIYQIIVLYLGFQKNHSYVLKSVLFSPSCLSWWQILRRNSREAATFGCLAYEWALLYLCWIVLCCGGQYFIPLATFCGKIFPNFFPSQVPLVSNVP